MRWYELLDRALLETKHILHFSDSEPKNEPLYCFSGFSVDWNIMVNYASWRLILHLP